MPSNESTMKFKADISQLKAAMQQASRSIKLADSAFKASVAGMKNWSNTTTGLQAKLKQLSATMKAQKQQISLTQNELKKTVAVYGENSAEADRVRVRLNNQVAALKKNEAQFDSYRQKAKELKDASKDIGEMPELDKQKQKVKDMESTLESLKQKYASLQLEERDTSTESKELASQIDKLSSELKKSKTDISNAEKAADSLDNSLDEAGDSAVGASDGFTVMKGALASLVADGIRLAIRYTKDLAKETFNAGANFEAAMSQVEAVSGASADEMEKLNAKAKEMGETTKFSASQSAEAFNYMAMAGWKTEDMINGIGGIMNLAAASGADLATTSDIVTDALTAMGYSAKDAGRLADVMAAASSNANTNVEMMGATFQYAAPLVGALGYNMEDTAVAIGLMANAGIKGEKAGTALRSMLSRLASPPKATAEALDGLGISLTDSEGKMKPFAAIMEELRKKFAGLSETEQTATAKAISGQEAMSGLLAIVNAAPEDFDKLTKAVENSNGAAQNMADTMNDNVLGQITLLKSKVEGIMIKVFEKASGKIRAAVDSISKKLDEINWDKVANKIGKGLGEAVKLFEWILDHSSEVAAGLKVIAAIMLTMFVTDKVAAYVNSVKSLITTYQALSTNTTIAATATKVLAMAQAALPFVAVAAGVALVTGAVIKYQKEHDKAVRSEYELTKAQKENVEAVKESASEYEQLAQARNDATKECTTEYNYLNELKDEYNSLIDSNGKVKKGYEERANFIVTTLANSLGVERSEIEKNIGKNGELEKSIDSLIRKKQAEALLTANEEIYNKAIQNRGKALQEYQKAQETAASAERKYNEIKEAGSAAEEHYQELLRTNPKHAQVYYNSVKDLIAAHDEAKSSYEKANKSLETAESTYLQYNNTIKNYEGLSAAVISGDNKKIAAELVNLQNNFITARNGNKKVLEQQVKDYEANYEALKKAVETGMPGVTQAEVDAAKKLVNKAKKELNKLPAQAKKSGEKAGSEHAKGVSNKSGENKKAGEKVAKATVNGEKTAAKSMKKDGENAGSNYASGVGSKAGAAKSAGKKLGKNADNGADSYKDNAKTSGKNFGQGFINGIGSLFNSVWAKAKELAKKAWQGLKKGQEEGSPSKLTFKSGVYFTQGYINGIASMQGKLVKTVQGMVKTVINELAGVNGFNYSEVASNASSKFAETLSTNISYMMAKLQYQNEAKLKQFDSTISKLEKERDAKIKALEKKENKKNKKSIQRQINAVKSQYNKLINTQNKYKTAYQTASGQMISELQSALNSYQAAAQKLIDDTINGITEKYNARYNELISKQDSLISKLKQAGTLFDVSSAGIMTVNDLKEQTKQIKDYTEKLAVIKEKVSSELFDEIAAADMKEGSAFIDRLLEMSAADLDAYNKAYTEKMEAAQKASESIYKSDFDKVASDYEKEINSAFEGLDKQLEELGNQAMEGFINGLTKNTDYMDKNVKTFVKSMVATFKKELKISSPSKVMFGIGEYTGEGFNDGLMSILKTVQGTVNNISNAVATPLNAVAGDFNDMRSRVNQSTAGDNVNTNNVVNNYNLVQNNNSPKSLSAIETYQARRRQIAMMKAATMNA